MERTYKQLTSIKDNRNFEPEDIERLIFAETGELETGQSQQVYQVIRRCHYRIEHNQRKQSRNRGTMTEQDEAIDFQSPILVEIDLKGNLTREEWAMFLMLCWGCSRKFMGEWFNITERAVINRIARINYTIKQLIK